MEFGKKKFSNVLKKGQLIQRISKYVHQIQILRMFGKDINGDFFPCLLEYFVLVKFFLNFSDFLMCVCNRRIQVVCRLMRYVFKIHVKLKSQIF